MNEYTKNAKKHLEANDCCLVYCNENEICTSHIRGVLSLVLMVKEKRTMEDFYCADKVVGKAAAFMYAILKPRELYAFVLSEKAKEVLDQYGIKYYYGEKVPAIINRKGDGFCPMETVTENAATPFEALSLLEKKLNIEGKVPKGITAEVPIVKEA